MFTSAGSFLRRAGRQSFSLRSALWNGREGHGKSDEKKQRQPQEVNKPIERSTRKRQMETKGSQSHRTGSSYRKRTLWYFSHWPLVHGGGGPAGRRALQAPSAWLVPGYVAMCSTWPTASAQRPFVVARVAGWGLPLIRGQVFISKGRGRAKRERERGGEKEREREKINREKREGGGGGEKSTSAANYWKNIKVFSVCVKRKKRKEGRGGRRRDRRLMARLCVSWRIVVRRGRSWPAGGDYRWREVFVWLLRLGFFFLFFFLVFSVCPFLFFIFYLSSSSFTISLRLRLPLVVAFLIAVFLSVTTVCC